ncbi:MAG TPA: HAD family acid phosphatase [Vicinamibacteria bacterium]|nr:HAD family acid phosphatase [Vicinamibacteria bacterium]
MAGPACHAAVQPPAAPAPRPGVQAVSATEPPSSARKALDDVCRRARDGATRRVDPHEDLDAILWLQTAAEYRANTTTVYRGAAAALPGLAAAARARGADPVVVLDLDETVFDNSHFQGRLLAEARNYDSDLWDCWVGQKQAGAVPGADLLFRAMTEKGIRARFITNRKCRPRAGDANPCPQEGETLENLNALLQDSGYVATAEELLLSAEADPTSGKPWDDEKQPRRDFVSASHEIVMLVGDDLGDFLAGVRRTTMAARAAEMARVSEKWGTSWFALPNPSYGSWLTAVDQEATSDRPRKRPDVIEAFPYPRE